LPPIGTHKRKAELAMRLEPWHVLLVLLVVVLLFGSRRLPDAARSLGRSMRIFKSEVDSMRGEDKKDETGASGTSGNSATSAGSAPLTGRVVDEPAAPRQQAPQGTGTNGTGGDSPASSADERR
jgi:sec-independent protein translocase protein TatA